MMVAVRCCLFVRFCHKCLQITRLCLPSSSEQAPIIGFTQINLTDDEAAKTLHAILNGGEGEEEEDAEDDE